MGRSVVVGAFLRVWLTAFVFTAAVCQPVAAAPARLAQDLARDASSRPQQVLPLLDLQPGDRVLDLFAGGGYYSELLASQVGPHGQVLLHNTRGFRAWGINGLNARFTNRSLPNVIQHDREIVDLDLDPATLDGALIVMAFHDLYVIPKRYDGERYVAVGPAADADHLLAQLFAALKPAGRLVVVDHAAGAETPHDQALELHRIHESFAHQQLEGAGFEFLEAPDLLRNPEDDRSMIVFDSPIRGHTDRFVLVFRKPESGSR